MSEYDNNFFDEYDLIEHLSRGCEVEFLYNMKKYSITHTNLGISITEFNNEDSKKTYTDEKQVIEHKIDNKKLKDIIGEMKVIDRSF